MVHSKSPTNIYQVSRNWIKPIWAEPASATEFKSHKQKQQVYLIESWPWPVDPSSYPHHMCRTEPLSSPPLICEIIHELLGKTVVLCHFFRFLDDAFPMTWTEISQIHNMHAFFRTWGHEDMEGLINWRRRVLFNTDPTKMEYDPLLLFSKGHCS